MENKELIDKIKISYRKLKSNAYFDKSEAILRQQIAEFELDEFEKKIESLGEMLENDSDEEWNKYIKSEIEELKIYRYPKFIKNDIKDNNIIFNQENTHKSINFYSKEEMQYRIGLSVQLHILSVLWIEEIGIKLDEKFLDISYGNRLLRNEKDKKNINCSPYLYKPYFNEYENWRDKGLDIAEQYYKDKVDCIIIMLDIKRFFYSVNFTQEIFDTFLNENEKEGLVKNRLNQLVYKIIVEYSKKINNGIDGGNNFLPIGFLPSGILANWYLDDFDKSIIDRINPSYYGRYVDDMIIVDKVNKNSKLSNILREEEVSLDDILNNYFIDYKVQCLIKDVEITESKKNIDSKTDSYKIKFNDTLHKGSNLEIQKNKFKVFYLNTNGTKAIIDKFKKSIKDNSSEFRMLPDSNNLFLDNYSDIYKLNQNESTNKLRGIDSIGIDKYELSKFIGKNLTIANIINDKKEFRFYDDLEKIFQPKIIIENYLIWESILNLCVINRKYDKFEEFINKIFSAINQIKENQDYENDLNNINIKNTLIEYLVSCILRSSTVIWEEKFENIISKLLKNINNKYIDSNCIRKGFTISRMVQKNNLAIILDMFVNSNNTIDFTLYNKELYLNDMTSSLEYLKDNIVNKESYDLPFIEFLNRESIENNYYRYRPYLITMQDINKMLFLNNALSGKVLTEKIYEKYTSEIIEDMYYTINYSMNNKEYERNITVKEINNNINFFKKEESFNIIKISKGYKKNIKIAIATARDKEENFEGVLMDEPNRTLERYRELAEIINSSIKENVDILILPENYVPYEWLNILEREVKKNNIAIITGVEHVKIGKNVYNLIATLFPYEYKDYKFVYTNLRTKVFYSPEEKRQINGYGYDYLEGNEYNLFIWNNIWIPVYCCFEIASISDRSKFISLTDLFVIVEWNKDTSYFSNIIESLSRDMHCYCVQVNTADYGDSCLIQPAKSYKQSILRTKGGINNCVLVGEINIDKLRRFQVKEYELQKDCKNEFKTTPPNFNKDAVRLKIKNKLFENI